MKKIHMAILDGIDFCRRSGPCGNQSRVFFNLPFAGGYFFEGNEGLKDSYLIGIRAGYHLRNR